MFNASKLLLRGATFALAITIPSLVFSQGVTEIPTQSADNNLQIQSGINRSMFEVLTNSAVAVESDETFSEISIANPDIADIYMLTDRSIYVIGKKAGRTTLMLLGETGEVMSIVDVIVTPDITEFKQRLARLLPDENIEAFTANDGIVLTGTVTSRAHMEKALELASHYAPDRVSNLMTLDGTGPVINLDEIQIRLAEVLPGEVINLRVVNDGIILSGVLSSQDKIALAESLVAQLVPGRVSNMLISSEVPVPPDAELLSARLQEILPDEAIELHAIGNTIVLSGTASSDRRIAQAVELMGLFSPGSAVTSLVSVQQPPACSVRTRRGDEVVEMPVPCS